MASRTRSIPNLILAAIVAALGYLNWLAWDMAIDTAPVEAGVSGQFERAAEGDRMAASLPRPSLSEFSETISRPLFHPSRRPVSEVAAKEPGAAPPSSPPPEPETDEPSGLNLVGLMGSGEKGRRALIRPQGETYGTWVEEGGRIAGWQLNSIDDDRVVIEKSGREEELVMDRSSQ